jgi:hypothetical protein
MIVRSKFTIVMTVAIYIKTEITLARIVNYDSSIINKSRDNLERNLRL